MNGGRLADNRFVTAPAHDGFHARGGLEEPGERRSAGRMIGSLWILGGGSCGLWYLVPGAELGHWQVGLLVSVLSVLFGIACVLAPWRWMSPGWIYFALAVSLVVIPVVMACNGGAVSPTIVYMFLPSVMFGYHLPTRPALIFLGLGALVYATPMLYDGRALETAYIAQVSLAAPIYAGVGLTMVIAKRQLVSWRDQATAQALLDPLTGLANRRALTNVLRETGAHAPAPLALVVIDVDDFKNVNTVYGHVGGDRVLRRVADALRAVTRDGDLVARLGGDEFAVVLSGATEPDMEALCGRIVGAIRKISLGPSTADTEHVTVSVGYSIRNHQGTVDEFLALADAEMREAKRRGKDRWRASSAPVLSEVAVL